MALNLSERATAAREALFHRYDELNALWTQAEEQLTKLHVPHGVECYYRDWEEAGGQFSAYAHLGLQKLGGKWRICHGYSCDADPEQSIDWIPITDCAADVRVAAAPHVALLREAVVKSAEEFVPKVDAAIAELRKELRTGDEHLKSLLAERAKLNGKAK